MFERTGSPRLHVPIDMGTGETTVVLFHGFGLGPGMYREVAEGLAEHCRVVVPSLFGVGRWRYRDVLDALTRTLDGLGVERSILVGHSFGGAIELGFAARHPERAVALVFADTLAISREFLLAEEALRHPFRLFWMATPQAAFGFGQTLFTHPIELWQAAWWSFTAGRSRDITRVAAAQIPTHVLWANRDSVLSRQDGENFAAELDATFTVAKTPDGRPVDHDWMFRHSTLFLHCLYQLNLPGLGIPHESPW